MIEFYWQFKIDKNKYKKAQCNIFYYRNKLTTSANRKPFVSGNNNDSTMKPRNVMPAYNQNAPCAVNTSISVKNVTETIKFVIQFTDVAIPTQSDRASKG